MNYWSSIKDEVSKELKNGKVEKVKLLKKDYVECTHKPKIKT